MTHDDTTLQAAIDAALQTNGEKYDGYLVTLSDHYAWSREDSARLAVAKAFLAALQPAESSPAREASQEADPYAKEKAAHAAGKVIQYTDDNNYNGKWQDCPRPQWVKESEHNINPRYRVKPEAFKAHGKTWTRHNPSDPMPCDGKAKIEVIFQDGSFSGLPTAASIWEWSKENPQNEWIIGWRYADQPAEPAPSWEPAVGDVVRLKSGGPEMVISRLDNDDGAHCFRYSRTGIKQDRLPIACLEPVRKEVQP